jgi:hypothetical protein
MDQPRSEVKKKDLSPIMRFLHILMYLRTRSEAALSGFVRTQIYRPYYTVHGQKLDGARKCKLGFDIARLPICHLAMSPGNLATWQCR